MTLTPLMIAGIVVVSIAIIAFLIKIGLIGALLELLGEILSGLD